MEQGRQAIYNLLNSKTSWPPVVVPFGLDPYGWHGQRASYKALCNFALENCTLLPKVYPLDKPLCMDNNSSFYIETEEKRETENNTLRRHRLLGTSIPLSMEEVKSRGEMSWKTRKRWIESDEEFYMFLSLASLKPAYPDIDAIIKKEEQIAEKGLPYAEVRDPFSIVSEMLPTDLFYIKLFNDKQRIEKLLSLTQDRVIQSIKKLCSETVTPFILRMIGSEKAVPPFLSRKDFLYFEVPFYKKVASIAYKYDIPLAFHCHGPVKEILDDVWEMGYSFVEPFEPPPRGNLAITEALKITDGRGVVFGGIDDVLLSTGSLDDVHRTVSRCLEVARNSGKPFIISQSATPFFDPINQKIHQNIIKFLELSLKG